VFVERMCVCMRAGFGLRALRRLAYTVCMYGMSARPVYLLVPLVAHEVLKHALSHRPPGLCSSD
jgi:hypothetical protein